MCHEKEIRHFVVGKGLAPLHFLSKPFEILDFDPPNNPTSYYGACHFGYNLALKERCNTFEIVDNIIMNFKEWYDLNWFEFQTVSRTRKYSERQ